MTVLGLPRLLTVMAVLVRCGPRIMHLVLGAGPLRYADRCDRKTDAAKSTYPRSGGGRGREREGEKTADARSSQTDAAARVDSDTSADELSVDMVVNNAESKGWLSTLVSIVSGVHHCEAAPPPSFWLARTTDRISCSSSSEGVS